jgi:hypothetical protein
MAKAKVKTDALTPAMPLSTEQHKWQTEDALRTITRAEEIKTDRKLMQDVKRLATQQQKTLSRVVGGAGAKPAANVSSKSPPAPSSSRKR